MSDPSTLSANCLPLQSEIDGERDVDVRPVVIVGGGLAGLACAAALGSRQIPVVLMESRQRLGGRASSFVDIQTGEWLDNCQHVTMGCCTCFAAFCRQVGIDKLFVRERELVFVGPTGKRHRFAAQSLPAPMHLAWAFAGLSYLSLRDRVRLGFALRRLARTPANQLRGKSFLDWLNDQRQSPQAIEYFWHVVLVSALSETLDRIDAFHARKVFVDGFLSHRDGWEVSIPKVPLDRLYGQELISWFADHHVDVRLNAGVKRIRLIEQRATSDSHELDPAPSGRFELEFRNSTRVYADDVVLAVPAHSVPILVPELQDWWQSTTGPGQLTTAPISSIHLWYDRPITHDRHVTFVGRTSQWLFNRQLIQESLDAGPNRGQSFDKTAASSHSQTRNHPDAVIATSDNTESTRSSETGSWYCQVVISASHNLATQSSEETIKKVVGELRETLPLAGDARLIRSRLVTEHRAVLSMVPGVDSFRPGVASPIDGLWLAGDWIDTGWPSTMEGAVRSGWLAAERILAKRGEVVSLFPHPLPTARLAKWLFGL